LTDSVLPHLLPSTTLGAASEFEDQHNHYRLIY